MQKSAVKKALLTGAEDGVCFSSQDFAELLKAVLARKAAFRFKAKGFSMSPFINDGDVITLSSYLNSAPEQGDVVGFIHPKNGKLSIHRIVSKREGSYFIKGDNRRAADGFIRKEDILGRVTRVERNGKKISIGFGSERRLIALLSRKKLLPFLTFPSRLFARLFLKKQSI